MKFFGERIWKQKIIGFGNEFCRKRRKISIGKELLEIGGKVWYFGSYVKQGFKKRSE